MYFFDESVDLGLYFLLILSKLMFFELHIIFIKPYRIMQLMNKDFV